MRKYIICFLICLICLFSFVGCGVEGVDAFVTPYKGFVELDEEDLPDDYKDTGNYCYNEKTGLVYLIFDRSVVKLESADYEFYIYDKQKKEFAGYNH